MIGSPIRHSLSPAIHNAAFAHLGLDWAYLALEVASGDVPEALAGMRALGIAGLSVTMPHKEAVAAACDELSPAARRLRSVNTVVLQEQRLAGFSTDGDGFVASLLDAGCDPSGRRFLVLGAGGAARSVIQALQVAAAGQVIVVARRPEAAQAATDLGGSSARTGSAADIPLVDVVVNATPLGMADTAGRNAVPVDPALLRPEQVVVDLVYHPIRTPLLEAAEKAGARAVDGLGMLVHQAAAAFSLWTGHEAPVEVMKLAAVAALEAREKDRDLHAP